MPPISQFTSDQNVTDFNFYRTTLHRYYIDAEWKISNNWNFNAAFGQAYQEDEGVFDFIVPDRNGDFETGATPRNFKAVTTSAVASLRGSIKTGPVQHNLVFAGSYWDYDFFTPEGGGLASSLNTVTGNIFNSNVSASSPEFGPFAIDLNSVNTSFTLTTMNDMRFLNDKLSVLVGARYVSLEASGNSADEYDESAFTKLGAITYFPFENTSLYVSYAEGIEQGAIAGFEPGITNPGEVFDPARSQQIEIGAKYKLGDLLLTAAIFDLRQPLTFVRDNLDGTRTFTQDGEQRHRGIELRAEGNVGERLRLLGGLTLLDPEITENGNPEQEGNRPGSVPTFRATLFADYDLDLIPRLSLAAGVTYQNGEFLDLNNDPNLKTGGGAIVTLGGRYAFDVKNGDMLLTVNVTNLLDANFFTAGTFSSVNFQSPRQLQVRLTRSF